MVILYDEVYMTDEEWVRLLLSILRSVSSQSGDGREDTPAARAAGRRTVRRT